MASAARGTMLASGMASDTEAAASAAQVAAARRLGAAGRFRHCRRNERGGTPDSDQRKERRRTPAEPGEARDRVLRRGLWGADIFSAARVPKTTPSRR